MARCCFPATLSVRLQREARQRRNGKYDCFRSKRQQLESGLATHIAVFARVRRTAAGQASRPRDRPARFTQQIADYRQSARQTRVCAVSPEPLHCWLV